jgi:phosphoribosylformimino-5-aminoimidazole carboxamide ribotide isomerase
MEIIPAIDIIEGKCVRLSQGDFSRKVIYNENPLEVARQFADAGIKRLHLVDLDGAKGGKVVHQRVLERIATGTSLVIDFGGGLKTTGDLLSIFNAGASLAAVGSMAVKDPELFAHWLQLFGSDKILLGADVKDGHIAINGWQETTPLPVLEFIKTNIDVGVKQLFCTDVSMDGELKGPAIELYTTILKAHPELYFIASGGVSERNDLDRLDAIGCSGVIIGKALYEGKIKLTELKELLSGC